MLVLVQVLRAAAALMVVWHHARHEAGLTTTPDAAALLPWWAGVDLFFVISGFVIVHASAGLFAAPGARSRFLAHRLARVVPLYWLATGLTLAVALVRPGLLNEAAPLVRDPAYVAGSFLFWPAPRPDGSVQPLYGLGWTLNAEMFFYVLFALGLGFGRRGAVAWLWAALGLLVAAGAAAPLPLPLSFWADPMVAEFALGAGLALARAEMVRAGLRLPDGARIALAALGMIGLALAARHLAGAGEVAGFARPLLAGLPSGLLVAAAALGPERDRAGIAALPAPVRWLSGLGDASYALYLAHPFALRLVRLASSGLPSATAAALMVGMSVAAALFVHRLIELPMTRAVRARLDRDPPDWSPARR